MAITIQGPDGVSIDFPEGTSEADMQAAMAQAYPHPSDTAPSGNAMSGAARALETNLPFVDRAVAAAKSALPQGYGGTGQDYATNLAAEKAKNAQFAEQNPWTTAVGGLAAYAPAALLPAGGASLLGRTGVGAATGFGLGGLQGLSNSPDLTNNQETSRDIAEGAISGGALGAAGVPIAHAVGSGASALASALRGGPGPSDLATLQAAKQAAYQNVKEMGATYSPESFKGLVNDIAAGAKEQGINPSLHPGAASVIKDMQERAAQDTPISLPELDQIRQIAWRDSASKPDAGERVFGNQIRNNIDEFIANAGPEQMAGRTVPAETQEPALGAGPSLAITPKGFGGYGASIEVADASGSPLAKMEIRKEGNNINVTNIESHSENPVGSIGTATIRDIARKLGEAYPDAETISGLHITGAGAGQARETKIAIPRASSALPSEETRLPGVGEFDPALGRERNIFDSRSMEAFQDAGSRYRERARARGFDPDMSPAPWQEEGGNWRDAFAGQENEPAAAEAVPSIAVSPPGASAQEAAAAIGNARDLATRQFKAQALTDALNKADINAAKIGIGGNTENATRQRLAAILEKEPWSAEEKAQLNKMVFGTPVTNTMRALSSLSPARNMGVTGLAELLSEGAFGSHLPLGAAAVGLASHAGSALARRNAQNKLMATILAGGKAPVQAASSQPVSRAAMAAALAANAGLQAPRSQAPQP